MTNLHWLGPCLCAAVLAAAAPGGSGTVDPLVKTLLDSPTPTRKTTRQRGPFFAALEQLARRQHLDPKGYLNLLEPGKPTRVLLTQASAVPLDVEQERFILAILRAPVLEIPGPAGEQLVLLRPDGTILDHISCMISARFGSLKTEVTDKPDEDGARAVIRFTPHEKGGSHFFHEIVYGGKLYSYTDDPSRPAAEWLEKGLCRIAVQKSKLVVLFPALQTGAGQTR